MPGFDNPPLAEGQGGGGTGGTFPEFLGKEFWAAEAGGGGGGGTDGVGVELDVVPEGLGGGGGGGGSVVAAELFVLDGEERGWEAEEGGGGGGGIEDDEVCCPVEDGGAGGGGGGGGPLNESLPVERDVSGREEGGGWDKDGEESAGSGGGVTNDF